MEEKFIQVTSLDQLKELIKKNGEDVCHECFVQTGLGRSWKLISHCPTAEKPWFITNEIDESEQELTDEELFDANLTHVGDAINKGAFYYGWC